ncbi:response regulator transcription factor [Actinoplanes sp. TBRC 11911]|nr:response regulator transcription factor [Actinoplanes sp. TBRC 11911]
MIRAGLSRTLSTVPDLDVSQEAPDLASLDPSRPPTVLVLDLDDRERGRIAEGFWSRLPPLASTVVLCPPNNPVNLPAALRYGVRALLTRESATTELLIAVEAARHGGVHISTSLLTDVFPESRVTPHLATREVEALRWLVQGLTHGQIGRRMGLSEATVNTYVKRIRAKLGVGNKADLTRRAIELGYIPPHPRQ